MLDHHDVRAVLAADRADSLAASYGPSRPLRLRLGLVLVAAGERLARPYAPARVRVTYARVR